jgi:hypothetical protein
VNNTVSPSILFASPMSLLDITSGAALSMRSFLSALAARGFRAVALQATLFDSTHGGEHVIAAGEQAKDKKILRSQVLGVEHIIVRTKASRRPEMTCEEQERYLQCFRSELKNRRPEMIILWGGMLLEMTIMREAREAGIPVVFYLVNSGYRHKSTFRYVSAVVTDTQATADMYRERLGMVCHPIGKFIDPSLFKAPVHRPEFITFINPSFEKGVNVFLPMAAKAAHEHPEIKFLVVESRGRWGVALKVLGFRAEQFPNVTVIGHQKDMRRVYANTRALLLPSTWIESGARVIAEALLNGIPIVASNTGGSAELVGAGGLILDLPEAVREKKTTPADENTVSQWLEAVSRLWFDTGYYEALCAKAREEAVQHDINHNIDRFLKIIGPLTRSKEEQNQEPNSSTPNFKSLLGQALTKKKNRQTARSSKKRA